MGQIADNRAQTLANTIVDFKKPTLKQLEETSETLGQIPDNRAQTPAIIICSILEEHLKTTNKT